MSCNTNKTTTEIKRGSTFEQTLSCLDESETYVNISGWTVESDLKVSPDETGLLSFDVDDSLFVSGIVNISATPAQTLTLPANLNLQYDVKFTEPSGQIHYTETLYLKTSKHITD